jgi:hypothetical protein
MYKFCCMIRWYLFSFCKKLKSSLFWHVTQCRLQVSYWRFGTVCRFRLQGPSRPVPVLSVPRQEKKNLLYNPKMRAPYSLNYASGLTAGHFVLVQERWGVAVLQAHPFALWTAPRGVLRCLFIRRHFHTLQPPMLWSSTLQVTLVIHWHRVRLRCEKSKNCIWIIKIWTTLRSPSW